MSASLLASESFNLAQASDWTRRFREQSEHGVRGHLFSRADLEAVLAQPNAEGIRFYYGRDEQNQPRLVMVGVDAADNDIISSMPKADAPTVSSFTATSPELAATSSLTGEDNSGVVGPGRMCPPFCGADNTLNS